MGGRGWRGGAAIRSAWARRSLTCCTQRPQTDIVVKEQRVTATPASCPNNHKSGNQHPGYQILAICWPVPAPRRGVHHAAQCAAQASADARADGCAVSLSLRVPGALDGDPRLPAHWSGRCARGGARSAPPHAGRAARPCSSATPIGRVR